MKRSESLAVVLLAGALVLACSSGDGNGSGASAGAGGDNSGTGGTSASEQSAAGSGGAPQTGGILASGGASSSGRTTGSGGSTPGLGGTTGAGGTTSASGSGLGGATGTGGATRSGGSTAGLGGTTAAGETSGPGGATGAGGATPAGGTTGTGGATTAGGTSAAGGASGAGGTGGKSPASGSGGTNNSGGFVTTGGSSTKGAAGGNSASSAPGGSSGTSTCGASAGAGPVGVLTDPGSTNPSPPNPPGITFKDTDGDLVNAHGGGIIQVCDTFYLHGEYFLSNSTTNMFNGFSMYSSKELVTWKKEGNKGIILPQQSGGELGPNRKGERPHIIKCPATGEFVLYAHAADSTYQADKEVVYATSPTVNAVYSYKGPLLNGSAKAEHSDMSAFADETGAYVVTESGHVFTLAKDCHSWTADNQYSTLNGTTGGIEAPTVFKDTNGTYYFIGSDKTGWRANDDFYSTAKSMNGPWTYKGYIAPQGKLAWMTQSTWVLPIKGSQGTVFMYWGDHWYGNQDTTAPGDHNYLATYVFQPLILTGGTTLLPTYLTTWKIDVGAGTWSQ
jgi:hypothetical protein